MDTKYCIVATWEYGFFGAAEMTVNNDVAQVVAAKLLLRKLIEKAEADGDTKLAAFLQDQMSQLRWTDGLLVSDDIVFTMVEMKGWYINGDEVNEDDWSDIEYKWSDVPADGFYAVI